MAGYDCRNNCVFSFRRKNVNDKADVMSSGKRLHSFRPAETNDRWPTVTRRDGRTVSAWVGHALPLDPTGEGVLFPQTPVVSMTAVHRVDGTPKISDICI